MREFLDWMAGAPLRVLIILVAASLVQAFGSRAITRAMNKLASVDLVPGPRNIVARQKERASTIGGVLSATLKATTWIVLEYHFFQGFILASMKKMSILASMVSVYHIRCMNLRG